MLPGIRSTVRKTRGDGITLRSLDPLDGSYAGVNQIKVSELAWEHEGFPRYTPERFFLRVATFEVSYHIDWKSLSRFSLRGLIQTPPISSTVNRDEAIPSIFKIIWFFFFGNYYRYREAFSIKLMLYRCNCNYLYNYNGISRYIRYRLVVLVLKLMGSGIFHTFRWTRNH